MKVSDYIAKFLAQNKVTHAFGMSGGAAVHMFDSIDKRKDINIITMTHEQCAAMAADGYARTTGNIGVAICTSGPGATNLLTGTCSSFYDSVPTLMLTGQVSTHRLKGRKKIRQFGFQETDVVSIFKTVTKYAVQVKSAKDIKKILEKALFIAYDGRPGPVLVDIPDNLQREEIDEEKLKSFKIRKSKNEEKNLKENIEKLILKIKSAKRPVFILGGGLKTPHVGPNLIHCINEINIPVIVTWAGLDLIPNENILKIGTFGVYGSRAGNYTIQNADLIIALGTRLSQNLTGGILKSFAREADIVMVDVDEHEMNKFNDLEIKINLKIKTRLAEFIQELRDQNKSLIKIETYEWKKKINHWKEIFAKNEEDKIELKENTIDANEFVVALSNKLPEKSIIFADTGGNLTWTCNSFIIKNDQRMYSSWNHTPMGYSLPAAIGASISNKNKNIICIIGDGGLMICLAELSTIVYHKLPIKIFLFNNHSHGIQKQTLETWLGGRKVGVDPSSGVALPSDWTEVGKSLGMLTYTIKSLVKIKEQLNEIYKNQVPVLINVEINPDQKLYPFLKYGDPLEYQSPIIKNIDMCKEMIIKPYKINSNGDNSKILNKKFGDW